MGDPVLLQTDGGPLRFTDEKQLAQFEMGVASAVFLWDDLSTAVANGWGGPESEAKREWMAAAVVDLFDENEVATEDVEYRLLAAMEDEFDVTVETGTALVVAERVMRLYQEIAENNFTFAKELFDKYQSHHPLNQKVTVQDQDGSDGSDDDASGEEGEPALMEVDDTPAKNEPVVDEDGFQVVQRKHRH